MVQTGNHSRVSSGEPHWNTKALPDGDRERFRRYADARAFANGAQWATRQRPGETRLTFNYARALVRKVASYLFPTPVTFTVPATGDQRGANRAERAFADAIAANDLARLDIDLCIEALTLGDAVMKVTWSAQAGRPVVAAVDPATLIVETAADNPRAMLQAVQTYGLTGAELRQTFGDALKRAFFEPERLYPVTETWTDDRWRVEIAGQPLRDERNPYGWIPYVVVSNNPAPHVFWGQSELTDLYDVCQELNRRMSVLSRVLELSGAPIAVLENVDGSEGITVGPGAKWELPEGARAYLLDLLGGGSVGLHIDYVNLLFRVLHDLSETPRTAFGDSGRALSGAALEVEIQPLVQKVSRTRRTWDGVYQARNARILDLLERFGDEEIDGQRRTVTVWPGILPSDTAGAVRNAVALVESGIQSRHSAIASLGGDDPDNELAMIARERAALAAPIDNSASN
jgi:hypothetical protein